MNAEAQEVLRSASSLTSKSLTKVFAIAILQGKIQALENFRDGGVGYDPLSLGGRELCDLHLKRLSTAIKELEAK